MKKSLKSTIFKVLQNRQFFNRSRWNLDEARLQTLVYTCIQFESSSSTPSYLTRVHKVPYLKRDRQTDGRTDGRTDRRTDRRTSSTLYPLVFTGDNNEWKTTVSFIRFYWLSTFIRPHRNTFCDFCFGSGNRYTPMRENKYYIKIIISLIQRNIQAILFYVIPYLDIMWEQYILTTILNLYNSIVLRNRSINYGKKDRKIKWLH